MGKMDRQTEDKGTPDRGMRQTRTDFGEKGESGEKMPKGASRIDKERHESLKGAVGMGKEDKPRNYGPMDKIHEDTNADGNGHAYHHEREYGKENY